MRRVLVTFETTIHDQVPEHVLLTDEHVQTSLEALRQIVRAAVGKRLKARDIRLELLDTPEADE